LQTTSTIRGTPVFENNRIFEFAITETQPIENHQPKPQKPIIAFSIDEKCGLEGETEPLK
jgi:hypothetical protein